MKSESFAKQRSEMEQWVQECADARRAGNLKKVSPLVSCPIPTQS